MYDCPEKQNCYSFSLWQTRMILALMDTVGVRIYAGHEPVLR